MRLKSLSYLLVLLPLLTGCDKREDDPATTAPVPDLVGFDWQPDSVISDSISLDPDSDGINDIRFRVFSVYAGSSPSGGSYYNYFAQVLSLASNVSVSPGVILNASVNSWNCLDSGDVIGPGLDWSAAFYVRGSVVQFGSIGVWDLNRPGGYIGFKIGSNEGFRYGWYRLQASAGISFTLQSFGFNRTAGSIIHAGE